ncbi:AAA family ATPase [Gemmata sp.]|uniref:AAA family ATPase n=1 Tax=Gemmata sp. TaxID=1914242 RepID=UPI003F72CFBD
MARSDLIKRLFRSFRLGDQPGFVAAAHEMIDEERKKHHTVLADELAHILDARNERNGTSHHRFDALPKDKERGTDLVEVFSPRHRLDDLVLAPPQVEALRTVCREVQGWDVLEANGLRPASRLLFCGPPGCGKSVTAEAVAAALARPLLYVRFDSVVSSLLGETAANLRKVFDFASRGTWVVLFDEFDAIGRSRDDATEHGELKRVVNAFLQMLDRFEGRSVIIAATNFEESLDPALWRRFDEVMRFQRPTADQVESLVRRRCAAWLGPKAGVAGIVRELVGSSHAEVERVCYDAAKRAALAGRPVLAAEDWSYALGRHGVRRQTMDARPADRPPEVDRE